MLRLAVASGKGGTGKTAVAVNMAAALARQGQNIQLLDCDAEEPNDHLFLPGEMQERKECRAMIPLFDNKICTLCGECARRCAFRAIAVTSKQVLFFPELCHGCGGCLLFCPHGAIKEGKKTVGEVFVSRTQVNGLDLIWGKTEPGTAQSALVIKEVRTRAAADVPAIIDAAPGVTCPAVAGVNGVDMCLLITEPTPFGLHDLKLAVEMTETLHVPYGVVINKAGQGGEEVYDYCRSAGIPILLEIPFRRELAESYARGELWVDMDTEWQEVFTKLWADAKRMAV